MSTSRWAVTLQCDYPGCQSVGDASSREEPPAGWLTIDYHVQIGDTYGNRLTDFCSLHADTPLSKFIAAITAADKRASV